jgi:hypothetical protein
MDVDVPTPFRTPAEAAVEERGGRNTGEPLSAAELRSE